MCDKDHFHRLEDRADRRSASLILTAALLGALGVMIPGVM